MILISAHIDTVFYPYKLQYNNGRFIGLLDNIIGIFTSLVLIEEPNLALLEKHGKIKLFFGSSEEWGTITKMPKLKSDDIVLVVDVASGSQYKNVDASLENISGFTKEKLKELRESLEWEGFKIKTKLYDGNPDDEDEAWFWRKSKQKVISFIIPIEGESWHREDCSISYENLVKAKQILKRTINYLL